MKRTRRLLVASSVVGVFGVAAAAPVRFDVIVSPNPIKASEFADVTVKAIDENGNVDTSYTDGDIWIEVEGFEYTDPDVTIPGAGIGFFEASDQGVKIFSKGLTIKKPGTYTLSVADVFDTSLKGSTQIQVLASSSGPVTGSLTVTSPTSGSVETEDPLNIVGRTSYPNTPIVIMIDQQKVDEGLSDQNGDFTVPVSGIGPGEHILEVNALDLEDTVVATSGRIPFKYEASTGALFLGLDINPGRDVFVDQKVTFTVRTTDRVTSALLQFADGTPVPTTKVKDGEFVKEMSFDEAGTYPIHVTLRVQGENYLFENVDAMKVSDMMRKILSLEATPDPAANKADLVRTYTGVIDYFKVRYGTNKTNLRLSLTTSKPSGTLILADPTQAYYAQVFPVDENGVVNGEPSDVVQIGPFRDPDPVCGNGVVEQGEICDDGNLSAGDGCTAQCQIEQRQQPEQNAAPEQQPAAPTAQTCYPQGIQLSTVQLNGRYYLKWNPVMNVKEYVIYRADQAVSSTNQMQVVGRTNDTMFEYPFDPSSTVDRRAWYAVEAVCDNNDRKAVGDMTPVKVGPEKALLMLVLGSLFVFGMTRLAKSRNEG